MVMGKCRTCGESIRSRASSKHSAQANFLSAVKRHYKKKHPNTIGRRISASLKQDDDNPTIQDFVSALQGAPTKAIQAYEELRKRDWMKLKRVMDAMEPIMPVDMRATWKAVEAFHDYRKRG